MTARAITGHIKEDLGECIKRDTLTSEDSVMVLKPSLLFYKECLISNEAVTSDILGCKMIMKREIAVSYRVCCYFIGSCVLYVGYNIL